MRNASISYAKNHLSSLLDFVRHGETVLILDRKRPVARLEPATVSESSPGADEPWLAELERQGALRRGRSVLKAAWLAKRPPRPSRETDVVAALLADREE